MINTALYPALMWNGRFNSLSGDPFDNSLGFRFPFPEADVRFSHVNDVQHGVTQLLQAQAHMPPTELIEVAGFTGTCPNGVPDPTLGSDFCQFDDGLGQPVPLPDPATGSRNEPIRQKALQILKATPAYRALFGEVFAAVAQGAPIDFFMFGKAIAEFELTLVFADAPIDQFARGDHLAMTAEEKRGALVFFGNAGCVTCHAVAGHSNEMFSDFEEHVTGVPQIAPAFGTTLGPVACDRLETWRAVWPLNRCTHIGEERKKKGPTQRTSLRLSTDGGAFDRRYRRPLSARMITISKINPRPPLG